MRTLRPGWNFYLVLLAAMGLSFVMHEAAHWAAGRALGYDMRMSLNGAAPIGGFRDSADAAWVSAAGPAFTLLQAMLAFAVVRMRRSLPAYAFLFAACFMRFAAAAVSVVHPNDEARLSLAWGWGTWTLPVVMVCVLLALTVSAARQLGLGWRTHVLCYLLCSAATAAIVFLDAR